ncbi:MAG: PAS domain S-box protein [Anaerolineae bacterium]|nr:PAS domain S-box protein [Anaerolineae bacterium]
MHSENDNAAEHRFQKLIEYSQDHITLVDAQGKILYSNPSIEQLLGYTVEEYVGLSGIDLLHPDDAPIVAQLLQTMTASPGMIQKIEVRGRHKQGHYIWVEATLTNRLHDPAIGAIVSTSRNITERREAQERLHRNETMFQRTFDQAAVGISHLAPDGRWLWVNQRLCDIVGYTSEQMLGKSFQELTHPDDLPAGLQATSEMLAGTMQTYATHKRYIHQTGRLIWVKLTINLVRDEQGEPDYFVSVVEDITSLKQAEQQLIQSEERYRHIVEDQTDLISRYRPDLTLTFVNTVYSSLFGKTPEELLGRHILEFVPLEEREWVAAHIHSLNPVHPIAISENRLILPDGTTRWFQWTNRITVDKAGEIVEYQSVGRDITELKRLEETAQEQRRFAEILRDSLALLTTSLDVNQILQQILEYAESVVPYDAASIILFEGDEAHVKYTRGFPADSEIFFKDYRFSIQTPKYESIYLHKQPYLITDTRSAPDWISLPVTQWIRSTIGTPIELRGKVIGLLIVDSAKPDHFQQEDVDKLMIFARYASLALENADHVTRLEQKVTERTAELNTAKERLEAILNSSMDGIVLTRADLRIRQSNAAFSQMFACDANNCFDQPLLDLVVPEDVVRIAAVLESVMNDHIGKRVEAHARRQNGTIFDAEFSFAAIYAKASESHGLVCTVQDITERKSREQQLRYHAALQENVSDAVIATDLELRIQSWNKAAEKIYGWTAEEVIGKSVSEILSTEYDSPEERERLRQELLEHNDWHGEVMQHRKDGEILYVLGSVDLFEDENGAPIGIVAVNHNITERKLAERALNVKREQEREFQLHLKALQEMTIELAQINELDAFYKRVVELGLERLGFERLGLLLYDEQQHSAIGTYGTDASGKIRMENQIRFDPSMRTGLLQRAIDHPEHLAFDENESIYDNAEVIATGWKAAALLWNGTHSLGWLTTDNAVHHKPVSQPQLDILTLYSLTVGTLLAQKQTQTALRDSEEKFRLLVEHAPEAIIISNAQGIITLINAEAENIFGYAREELLGRPIETLVPEKHRDSHRSHRQGYVGNPSVRLHGEVEGLSARHKDGTDFLADVHLSYVKTHDDLLVMSFVTDVTERKQTELALEKYASEVHDLYNNAPCGYHSLDKDAVFVQINDTELGWLGYDYQEVVGKMKLTDVLTPESVKAFQVNFHVLKERGWLKDVEYDLVSKDGSIITVLLSAVAVYDDDGNYLKNRATLYDITDMKVVLEAIRESESRYRLLAENITDMVIRLNLKAEYVYVSPSSQTVLGYEPEEMIGQSGFNFIHPDDLPAIQQAFIEAAGQRTPYAPLIARFRHKDGHYVWLEILGRTIWSDETGQPIEFVTSSRDITVRKQAEEALLQTLAKEKELNELKSRFVTIASHEFRTPLTAILSSAEMLIRYRARMEDEQINRKLNGIAEQVQYLANIIEDVLSLERMKSGKVEFKPAEMDLDLLCRDVIENFESHPEMANRLHYTNASVPSVNLDKRLMRQVIINLVGNAIKYSPENRPVFVSLKHQDNAIMLEVRDQGIGIPKDDLNHLYEAFHRAANVGTISGTGLGLSITRQAIELHGGTISIQSEVGVGTTVTVHIPLSPDASAAP